MSNKRLSQFDLVKNPYRGNIIRLGNTKDYDNDKYIIIMSPAFPRFYWVGGLWIALGLLFNGFTFSFWLIPGAILLSLGVLWSKWLIYIVLRVALRRKGYQDTIKIIHDKEVISSMVDTLL